MKTYLIRLRGVVDVDELNLMSPHQMTVVDSERSSDLLSSALQSSALLSISTDQAGMIGLLRHLHNLGLEILSIAVQVETIPDEMERKAE